MGTLIDQRLRLRYGGGNLIAERLEVCEARRAEAALARAREVQELTGIAMAPYTTGEVAELPQSLWQEGGAQLDWVNFFLSSYPHVPLETQGELRALGELPLAERWQRISESPQLTRLYWRGPAERNQPVSGLARIQLADDTEQLRQMKELATRISPDEEGRWGLVFDRDESAATGQKVLRAPTPVERWLLEESGLGIFRDKLEPIERKRLAQARTMWVKGKGERLASEAAYWVYRALPRLVHRFEPESATGFYRELEEAEPRTGMGREIAREVAHIPAELWVVGKGFQLAGAAARGVGALAGTRAAGKLLAPAARAVQRVGGRRAAGALTRMAAEHPVAAHTLAAAGRGAAKGVTVGAALGAAEVLGTGLPAMEQLAYIAESAGWFGGLGALFGAIGGYAQTEPLRRSRALQKAYGDVLEQYRNVMQGQPDAVGTVAAWSSFAKKAKAAGLPVSEQFTARLQELRKIIKTDAGRQYIETLLRRRPEHAGAALPGPAAAAPTPTPPAAPTGAPGAAGWLTPAGAQAAVQKVGAEAGAALAAKEALSRGDMRALGVDVPTSKTERARFQGLLREQLPEAEAPPAEAEAGRARVGKSKRVRELEKQVADTKQRIWRVEQMARRAPRETTALDALREQLKALERTAEEASGVPRQYVRELNRKTARQLAADVQKLGKKARPEERSAARSVYAAQKVISEIRGRYQKLVKETRLTPVLDYLRQEGKRIFYAPGQDMATEITEFLSGKSINVRRFFKKVKALAEVPWGEALDEVAQDLALSGVLPADARGEDLLRAIEHEAAVSKDWQTELRRQAAEEAWELSRLEAVEGKRYEATVAKDLERLERAEAGLDAAAEQLRETRAEEMAISTMPLAQKAAKILKRDIGEMEKLAARATEAKETAIKQELAWLREELRVLETKLAEEGNLPELRRYIAQRRQVKGITKERFGEIVAKVAPPLKGGKLQRTTKNNNDFDVLLKDLAAVERERPKQVRHRKVITAKRERHIQQLRKNLLADGGLTDRDFIRQLRELRIIEPRYVDAANFITEERARALIDKMIDEAPMIREREATARALEEKPQMNGLVDAQKRLALERRQKREAQGKKVTTNPFLDFRYYLVRMDDQTGVPFYDAGMATVKAKRDVELSVVGEFDRIRDAVGAEAYKEIAQDREALDRVNDLIACKLKRPGAPPRPENATADEVRMAQAIEQVLHDQRNNVRWERFLDKRYKNREIPDADARQLNRANDIYESQGPEAARAYLDTLEWGVIKSGYEPESVVIPRIHHGYEPPIQYGTKGIQVREAEFQRQHKSILVRLNSYLYRRYNRQMLEPRIRAFVSLWEANADRFEKPGRVAKELGAAISELSGAPASDAVIARTLRKLYSHALLAKVLIVPAKSLRNAFQTTAFYTDKTDLVNPRNRSLTPEEMDYYHNYVSQLPGLRRDLFMEQEKLPKILAGLQRYIDVARKIAPYRFADEYPRMSCFWAKLNRVERALKSHPDDVVAMLNAAAVQDLEPRQGRAAFEMLARDGEDAFKRFVAHEVTNNVHFVYERAQRAPAEHGPIGRIVGNLLTFPRGYFQRIAKELMKLRKGSIFDRYRALKTLLSLVVAGWLVGEGYRRITGGRRNPYHPFEILNWGPGGLIVGGAETFNELLRHTEDALRGERGAVERSLRALTEVNSMFLPGYDQVLDGVEGLTDTEGIDLYALRRLRAALSKRYKPRSIEQKRTAVEKWQKVLFGGARYPLGDIATRDAVNRARRTGVDIRKVRGTLSGGRVGILDVNRYIKIREALRRGGKALERRRLPAEQRAGQ